MSVGPFKFNDPHPAVLEHLEWLKCGGSWFTPADFSGSPIERFSKDIRRSRRLRHGAPNGDTIERNRRPRACG